jgi:DNA polymerase-1
MYPAVAEAVNKGEVLLEWNSKTQGPPPKPLLKEVFAVDLRRPNVLHFSIAYGKTVRGSYTFCVSFLSSFFFLVLYCSHLFPLLTQIGLAEDFKVSVKEAQKTLDLWYSDRPEVRTWQEMSIRSAHETGAARTLNGRYRILPGINSKGRGERGHAERAAINTPLQGGAADIVMRAMVKLHQNERLKELGWKMVMQIHDELLLEGPSENSKEAFEIVVNNMKNPMSSPLLIDLVVDARIGKNWWECK